MTHVVLSAIGAVVAWIGWHIFHEAAAELVGRLLRPIAQPIWRAFLAARWRVPLLYAAMPLGIAGLIKGCALLSNSPERADVGLALFFGGAGLFILALILRSETKREAPLICETATRSLGKRA
jgi:hypothetical protein